MATRSAGKIPSSFPTLADTQSGGRNVPNVNLNEVTVLPRREWERIMEQLSGETRSERNAIAEAEQRKKIKQQSKALVGTWTNTIAGQRLKKLEARKIREIEEEEERKAIDVEEAKFQAEKREQRLNEAKKLQYWKTDRVKGLHSALMLTEVLREREAQMALKKRMRSAQTDLDAQLLAKWEAENQESMMKEKEEALARHKATLRNRDFILGQVKDRRLDQNREKLRDKMEGIEIQDALRQYNEEMIRIDTIKEEEKRQMLRAHEETLSNKQLLAAIEKQSEEETDERIRRFAMAKREMARLRKEREKELHQEKLRIRDEQTERLGNLLMSMQNTEEERLLNALQQKEEKDAKEEEEKTRERMEMLDSITKYREETVARKAEREKQERLDALEMRKARLLADELFKEHEDNKARNRRKNEKALRQIHLEQAAEKREALMAEQQEGFGTHSKTQELERLEADQFADYAQEVIEEERARGAKNLYPLVKVANTSGRGPRFDNEGNRRSPASLTLDRQVDGASEVKKGQSNNTAKRLGFVWKQ